MKRWHHELYNLRIDPPEQHNRAQEYPEIVAELKEKMRNFKMDGLVARIK